MVKDRKKKVKEPFWKIKASPELKHITDHAGHIIDNSKISDLLDVLINFGLAWAGVETFRDWKGALVGPIALKLATSMNIVAGTAGVATLGVLGFAYAAGRGPEEPPQTPSVGPFTPGECPEGYTLMIRMGGYHCVVNHEVHFWQNRGWERYSDYLARMAP